MDCSIMPTGVPGVVTIQTTDFFYPLVDDPYTQGRIACANVLSDLYAMGVDRCDNMLMILGASRLMDKADRNIVTQEMIRGFNDQATKGGNTVVTGGQSVMNPWPIIGGVATTTCREGDYVDPFSAQPGDVIVLTKPLGTQVAVNCFQWLKDFERDRDDSLWTLVKDTISPNETHRAFRVAAESMARLNRNGSLMMRRYKAHGATDVTGFGLLGHAKNFAAHQNANVDLEIHTLPVIRTTPAVNEVFDFKLLQGYSAETSGGLMVALSPEHVDGFCRDLEEADGWPVWIIGRVVSGSGDARIVEDVTVIEL